MMKLKKALILSVCLLLAVVLAVPAFAAPEQAHVYINPVYKGVITRAEILANARNVAVPTVNAEDLAAYVEYDVAVADLRAQLVQRADTATVLLRTENEPTSDMLAGLFDDALAHTGVPNEGDYLRYTYGGYSAELTGGWIMSGVYYLPITYYPTWYTTGEQETEMTAAVEQLLAELALDSSTDYEKAFEVYEYICDNVTYDYENLEDDSHKLKYTPYAALINGTAVCQGYAGLLYRLMLELGVDSRVIAGDAGGPHGWNIVEMDGLYYNADSTWDAGWDQWDYFLVSPDNFTDHVRNPEFETPEFHTAYPMGESNYKPSAHTHTYTPSVTPPTCTEQGYTTYTCNLCGDSYMADYVEAEGHSFSEWYTTKEAAYPEQGEECRDCVKCSHVEFREVPLTVVTSGNFGKGSTPTDKVIYTLYSDGTMVIEGTGALFGNDWRGDDQPFIEYRKSVKHLIIGEGITSTTSGSLAKLSNLETIQFPSTLTRLPQNALMSSFKDTITEITIPKTVVYLGAYSIGHYTGDPSAYFTDVIIENPDIQLQDHTAVFNGGAKLDQLTLYSYGTANKVSAYAEKYGIRYIDLDNYLSGEIGGLEYVVYDGVLILSAVGEDAAIPVENQPWADLTDEITRIVIEPGITSIPEGAFCNYPVLTSVELPTDIKSIGNGAFAVTDGESVPLSLTIPKLIEFLGEGIFAGRCGVNVTAYYGSPAAELDEPNVNLILKKQFKLLLIGNSYTEDASCCGQGMPDSQLLNILQAMLGEDAEVTVGAIVSGGKGMHWHATQAELGNRAYSLRVISTESETWKSYGSVSSAEALSWADWDAVSLQPYNINVSTGQESVPYPDSTDPKFYHIEASSSYMLDHVARYAPNADVYFYMHWAQTSSTVLNAALSSYNKQAQFMPQVLGYAGTESGTQFKTIVPVGLSIQNARTTYLALLRYNTTAYADGNLNLITDAQIGLQRDGGHVSFNIGRYIAGLTFAETIVPESWRAEGYILPDIRITESVGRLPKEYTEIAQKSVFAAVESWKNGSLAVTNIEGYTEDPTVAAGETVGNLTLSLHCDADELAGKIAEQVLVALPADFAVDKVELPDNLTEENLTCDVTIRFGYTSLTVPVEFNFAPHDYAVGICTFCDHDCVEVTVDNGTLTVTCDELEPDTFIWLVSYDGNGKFVAMKRVTLGEALTLPAGERYMLLFVNDNWIPLRKQLDI